MGEGVTNPVGGAASSSADLPVEEPVASLLYAVRVATCWKLVLLLSLSCVVALRWTSRRRRRKKPCVSDQTSTSKQSSERDVAAETDNLTQKLLLAPSENVNDSLCLCETQTISPHTGSAGKSAPRLRRSVNTYEQGDSVSSLNKQPFERCTSFSALQLNTEVICAAGSQLLSKMDPKDIPELPEPQPDSFFTWDSGGSSGEYSFVHTAVELPKYPDGAISEEERQMLLLYMQNGHPELLLNSTPGSVNSQSLMNSSITDSILCDQAAVRGFLETIVEENSDDLRSPSECDETSLGWGSWDESDDDRVTVVEMQTSATNVSQNSSEPLHNSLHSDDTLQDKSGVTLTNAFPDKQERKENFSDISVIATGDNSRNQIHENEMSGRKANEKHSLALTGETSVNNFSLQVLAQQNDKGGVLCLDNAMLSPECVKFCDSKNQQIHFGESNTVDASEVSPSLNPLNLDKNDFETLWISANELEYPIETVNPWCENPELNSESSKNFPVECKNSDFFENNEKCSLADSSLIVLGSENDLCLVPSKITQNAPESKENAFMFSDDFKDYFLPLENYVPGFNRDITETNKEDVFVTENISVHLPFKNKGLRCFRIGFDSSLPNEQQEANEDNSISDDKMSPINSEIENSGSSDLQEAVFSPRDGDVVYGSTWLSKPEMKEPEKGKSGAEVRLTTTQADVQCTASIQSESPPPDNSRKSIPCLDQSASDDEIREVPNSLSRWQHHSDLQHVQEATSPITRWQHQTDLQMLPMDSASKQNIPSDDESDDGLPPQLKHIYSSFKMKDRKMSRIRIKEDKNNNFKTLGLWDNETKVTLPPFGSNSNESMPDPKHSEKNTLEAKEEDLDDLELDMFAVNSDSAGSNSRPLLNGETDIDDALKSFNHLDDYSSHSEESSETEGSYIINTIEDINIKEGKSPESSLEIGVTEQNNSDNSSNEEPNKLRTLSPENTCSDNSDNCPLCTDPSFKKSNINNLIFSESTNKEFMDSRVQSLFLNTFPTMLSLSQPNLCNNNTSADVTEKEPTDSPLTSSDSDEGIRAAKETKKRIKKRSKDNCNLELKHDDSGYVEDDEDDDEDDILCEKERNDLVTQMAPKSWEIADLANVRKSISSVFYESKSDKCRNADEGVQRDSTPQSFQEFAKPLDHSVSNNDIKLEHMDSEKWNIPENLSQFSAWLLDKELKKISCRDEMEKLIVSDIMSLREQTIAQFLKNSASFQEKDIFKLPEIFENKVSINTKGIKEEFFNSEILNIGSRDLNSESKHSSLITPVFNDTSLNFETGAGTNMQNFAETNSLTENKDKSNSDGSLSDEKLELSTDELSEEYYNYNFNTQVSKVFNMLDENYARKSSSNEALAEENYIKSLAYAKESDLKYSSNNSDIQQIVANSLSNAQYTKCDLELNADKSDASNYMNDKSELGDCKNDSQVIETHVNMNEVLSESAQHESETDAQSESSCQLTSGFVGDTTTGIESKVIDTTTLITSANALGDATNNINKMKSNSSLVAPSNVRDGVRNANNYDELTDAVNEKNDNDVAPSIDDELNHFPIKSGNRLVGADDLMTCGMYERKGAYECSVEEGENNTSLAAPRGETSEGKHVRGDSCHAYCCDDISTCSALLATHSFAFDNVSSSLAVSTDLLLDKIDTILINSDIKQLSNVSSDFSAETNIGSEKSPVLNISEVCSRPALDANDNTQPSILDYTEFNLDDAENSRSESCVLRSTHVNGEFATSNVFENAILNVNSSDSDSSAVSKPEDTLLSKLDKTLESNTQITSNHKKDISNELTTNLIEKDKGKPNIISSCIESVSNLKLNSEFIGGRANYERSQSVDRDTTNSKETLETSVGQSKSTPDLRRCHEQQYNSSVPLSALLSKSVSQRIQDYLGHSTRGGFLNRSLPPTERSRHYRRICVSTETVVERAARFEARSRSTCGPREGSVDSLASASRSGSCPPLNMRSRTLDTWNSDKNSRNYNKPTATVRPTVDAYRNSSSYLKKYSTADDKGFNNGVIKNNLSSKDDLMELITGYTEATKVTHKPPVPPSSSTTTQLHQSLKSARLKGKIASARKDFFERLSQQDLRPRDETKQSNNENLDFESGGLRRFDEFRRSAREERVRLAASHPDLGALEAAVRSSKRKIDQLKKKKKSGAVAGQAPLDAGPPQQSNSDMPSTTTMKDASLCLPYRRCTGEIAWASCAKRLQEAKAKSKGNLAQEQLEIVDVVHEQRSFWFKRPAETGDVRAQRPDTAGEDDYYDDDDDPASSHSNGGDSAIAAAVVENSEFLGTRARSMDFLLDADNREKVQPPENRLATGQGRVKSEHELRIERSLQNLTIPDWYKQSAWSKKPKEGFILRRGSEGSAGESRKRWQGFSSSRTPSATSLTTPPSSYSHRNIIVPKRVTPTSTEWRYVGSLVSSRESLTPASPSSLSPRECASATFQYGLNSSLSRWSSSRLSTSSAPLTALSVHRSFRQPYLGWRAAQASSGYTPSSGGASRSSPGVSPVAATTPLQGSRSESPRRGSQEHHYGYGLQQNQITSAATLRPDGSETADSSSRISPLALYDNTTNVFFNSNVEIPHSDSHAFDQQQRFSSAEMRRDRYSYTQSLYSGTVIVSPGTADDDRRNYNVDQVPRIVPGVEEERFSVVKSPQPPPRIWMESSFVGTKKDGSEPVLQPTRSIRIVPSDSVRAGTDKFSSARGSTSSSLRGTCATQTSMGEYVLRDFRRFGITL